MNLQFSTIKGRYMVDEVFSVTTDLLDNAFVLTRKGKVIAQMDHSGVITVQPTYLWDLSSGPAINDLNVDPVPSLVHDVLYEAMRRRKLSITCRKQADNIYRKMLEERGMFDWRARLRYAALRLFGHRSAKPRNSPEYKSLKAK